MPDSTAFSSNRSRLAGGRVETDGGGTRAAGRSRSGRSGSSSNSGNQTSPCRLNTTRTREPTTTSSAPAPTALLVSRTPGASSRATTSTTYGGVIPGSHIWAFRVTPTTTPVPGTVRQRVELGEAGGADGGTRVVGGATGAAALQPQLPLGPALPEGSGLGQQSRQRPVDPGLLDGARGHGAATSRITAPPMPPPAHMAATAMPPPRRRSSWTSVTSMRAPVAAIGWPRLQPLPFGVDLGRVDAEQLRCADAPGRREGLVDLEQVDVGDRQARRGRAPSGSPRSGRGRCSAGSTPTDAQDRTVASGVGRPGGESLGDHHERGGGVVDAGGVAGRDAEALDLGVQHLQRGQLLQARARGGGARRCRQSDAAVAAGDSIGTISSSKRPSSIAADGLAVRLAAPRRPSSSRVTPGLDRRCSSPTVIDMSMLGASGLSGCVGEHPRDPVHGRRRKRRSVWGLVEEEFTPPAMTQLVHARPDAAGRDLRRPPGPRRSAG